METFDGIKEFLKKVNNILNLSEDETNLLLSHKRVSSDKIELDGSLYSAWRILHNNALGPGKGGIRFHQDVSEDEIKSLSFWMSLKTALMGLPLGGAKGGIKINPKELNEKQLEHLSRSYIKSFHKYLGQDQDIPAPDVYTNSQIMAWMLDEFEKIKQRKEPGMITGKPMELGGIKLRDDATSKGGSIILNRFLERIDKKAEEITVAIQGFGNAGSNLALMLKKEGFKIIAVSDSKGGILDRRGLDIEKIIEIKKENKAVQDYKGIKISNEELLESNVKLLVLAALENQVTEKNAEKIKAQYILELANGPIDSKADEILYEKNIIVIPDILANAGGVVASYFEWLQNKIGNILEEEFLRKKLEEIMTKSFNQTFNLHQESNISLRNAAYILAIKRILKAEKLRGVIS